MKRRLAIICGFLVFVMLIGSCAAPAQIKVHESRNLEKAIEADKIIFVFDTNSQTSRYFRDYFIESFAYLTQDTPKRLSIMTGYEYAHSPYYDSNSAGVSDDCLFVMVKVDSRESGEFDTYTVTFVMTVQYQGQDPFLVEEINLGFANSFLETGNWRGHELAEIIHDELSKRNIL